MTFFESIEEQLMRENRFLRNDMQTVAQKATATKESSDKVRRKLFAENSELKKRMASLEIRLEVLERNICTGVI